MAQIMGLERPFQLLFSDEAAAGNSLPDELLAIYPGDWHLPEVGPRPYVYTNFATSRDGRISYNDPAYPGGGPISLTSAYDRWLMALLRMRAHAVLIGDVTLDVEPDHAWTAEFIYPPGADTFAQVRRREGYDAKPLLVLLSYDGKLNFEADCWQDDALVIVVATTTAGLANLSNRRFAATVHLFDLGAQAVDLHRLLRLLHDDFGVQHLLCEGGARVFANMLDAHLVDEEFVTLCPTFVGRSPDLFRPSYTEGVAWFPPTAPRSAPFSMHRAGDHLFLRTRVGYPDSR